MRRSGMTLVTTVAVALAIHGAAAAARAQDAGPDSAAARPPAAAADPAPGAAVHFPGSFWMSSGYVSPLEAGNLVTTYAAEQGFTVLKRGPHTVVPYGALTVSTDQQGFDWNNKAVPQVGLRYARAFTRGVIQVGAGYAYERRLRSKTGMGQPLGYASYWFGWTGHLSGGSSRSFWSSLPGTSWASVGNQAPAEGHNVIGSIYVQQGITAARVGKLSLIPFVEHTLTMDSGGQPWNNRRIRGGGVKVRILTGAGVIEGAVVHKHEHRWLDGQSGSGLGVTVSFWSGWNPSSTDHDGGH